MGSNTKTLKKGKGAFARAGTGRSPWKGNGGARDGAGRPARTPQQRRKLAAKLLGEARTEATCAQSFILDRVSRGSNAKILVKIANAVGRLKYAKTLIARK